MFRNWRSDVAVIIGALVGLTLGYLMLISPHPKGISFDHSTGLLFMFFASGLAVILAGAWLTSLQNTTGGTASAAAFAGVVWGLFFPVVSMIVWVVLYLMWTHWLITIIATLALTGWYRPEKNRE